MLVSLAAGSGGLAQRQPRPTRNGFCNLWFLEQHLNGPDEPTPPFADHSRVVNVKQEQ
jgi:hypothetical protein